MSLFLYLFIAFFLGYFVWLFITKKWQEVYITQNVEEYMKVSGALEAEHIKFKSTTGGQEFNASRSNKESLPAVSYSILVAEDKAYLAQKLINETLAK